MNAPHIATRAAIDRRRFLRGIGAGLSLPLLDAMTPAFSRAAAAQSAQPRRFVAMCAGLGFHAPYVIPTKTGREYEPTPYLETLRDLRDQYTVISGLSHPEQNGNNGHASEITWLTSAKRPGLAGFKNSISIDQWIAARVGTETRYPYLALSNGGDSLSWTDSGVEIPGESSPARLFNQLFVEGTEQEKAKQINELKRGRSILDTVAGEAKKLHGELGKHDQEKLDEYLSSVRDLEARLQVNGSWVNKPKPKIEAKAPTDIADRNDAIGKQRLMYDLMVLALQTDSTRTITYKLGGLNSVPTIPGVKQDWHQLSHHGQDEKKIEELKIIELAEFQAFHDFLARLKGIQENGKSLLDGTAVLYGSNLGNASSHSWRNLPIILAGGGYRHGQHLAHDEKNNTAFANLFVQIAQGLGLETGAFGSSTAEKIDGLELG